MPGWVWRPAAPPAGASRDRGDGGVAGREIEFLQRGALDAALLGNRDAGAREGNDSQSEQNFPEHDFLFSLCAQPSSGAQRGALVTRASA